MLRPLRKLLTVDEMRAGIEELDKTAYDKWGYYEKWIASITKALLRRGAVLPSDFPEFFGGAAEGDAGDAGQQFNVGDYVRVKGKWTLFSLTPSPSQSLSVSMRASNVGASLSGLPIASLSLPHAFPLGFPELLGGAAEGDAVDPVQQFNVGDYVRVKGMEDFPLWAR